MATTERSVAAMSTRVSAKTVVYDGVVDLEVNFLPEATSNLGTPWYLRRRGRPMLVTRAAASHIYSA